MERYLLAIIGGGPAGYRAAELAGKAGLSTVLFEKNALGGVCLNEGCIPTKALLNSAKIVAAAKNGARLGVKAGDIRLDHAAALAHKSRVVKTLVGGVELKLKNAGAVVVKETARIQGRAGDLLRIAAGEQVYLAEKLLIATGSVPVVPPIPGVQDALASGFAVTSGAMLNLAEIPGRLIVIGGGVIGLELASYYHEAGAGVEVIEMLPAIGGPLDASIAQLLQKSLEKSGIKFHLNAKVTSVENGAVQFEQNGAVQALQADKVLLCVGRRPDAQSLGLENIGIEPVRGAIPADEEGRAAEGVFVAGDVNGKSMLAHTAYREAELCINTMLGVEDAVNYHAIPAVIYTHPEVASVGYTEAVAREAGHDAASAQLSMRYSGRYLAENPGGNDVCIVVADKVTDRVLGVHMIGPYASEMIFGAAAFIERGMTLSEIRKVTFPHPTVSEVLREAAFEF